METETLKYAFGETPEAVVLERLFDCGTVALKAGKHLGHAAILTVLDALQEVCMIGPRADNPNDPAWRLRIEILAALGIDES